MAQATRRWSLFVDETGQMDGRERSMLGGLLMQAGDVSSWTTPLREDLEEIIAPIPWPSHAVELNRLSYHVLASVVWGDREDARSVPLRPAAVWLEERRRCLWKRLVKELAGGSRVVRRDLVRLDNALKKAPSAVKQPVYDRRELVRTQLALAVGTLGERLEREVHFVGAVVRRSEDAAAVGVLAASPWVEALRALLRRVLLLVGSSEERVIVQVRVADRRAGFAPAQATVHITGPVLMLAIRVATRGLPFADRVIWEVPHHRIDDKRSDAHPSLILADFALNRALRTVRGSEDMRWSDFVAELITQRAVGMGSGALPALAPSWAQGVVLPAIDHVGLSHERWLSALQEREQEPFQETTLWGEEQADAWVDALGMLP